MVESPQPSDSFSSPGLVVASVRPALHDETSDTASVQVRSTSATNTLRSPRPETTITAAELCAIGTWERVGGGYRVLDWEAVEVCLDLVRRDKGEDPRALAWDREHEARIQARMARPMVITPRCAACGTPAAHIELLAPG